MIGRAVARHGFALSVAALAAGICLVAAFLLVVALPDLAGTAAVLPSPTPTAAVPSATPLSAMGQSPIAVEMSATADCAACHLTTGGTVGTRTIPTMAHPLWGWRDCTACHANDRLVATAPGHSGLHRNECLVCHKVPDTTAATRPPLRPEHMGNTQPCTSCHGEDEHAPLPTSMAGRDNCWICHNGPEFSYLFESPSASAPSASPAPSAAAPSPITGTGLRPGGPTTP